MELKLRSLLTENIQVRGKFKDIQITNILWFHLIYTLGKFVQKRKHQKTVYVFTKKYIFLSTPYIFTGLRMHCQSPLNLLLGSPPTLYPHPPTHTQFYHKNHHVFWRQNHPFKSSESTWALWSWNVENCKLWTFLLLNTVYLNA